MQNVMCHLIHCIMRGFLPILLSVACSTPQRPPHVAPKGCRASVQFDGPIADGLGLSSHLEWGTSPIDAAYRDYEQQRWADLGLGIIRRDMSWDALEPEPGRFDLGPVDTVLHAVQSVDAQLVALLDYGNPGYPPYSDDVQVPPDDPADFARFAAELATQRGDAIRYYELWNEPNAGVQFWKPWEDPVAYAALVAQTSPAIRAADPDAFVVLGGLFWPSLVFNTSGSDFLDQVAAELPDLATLVDAVSIHPYRYPFNEPERPNELQASMVTEICEAWDQMQDMGLVDHELWIGELGWHTAPDALFPGPDEATHAAWLVRAAVLSFAQGARQFTWYTFRDSGDNVEDQEDMFGLVDFDPDPTDASPPRDKPAFAAFATLAQMLGEHDTIADASIPLELGIDEYGYQLSGGSGVTWVLWTTGPSVSVNVPAGSYIRAQLRTTEGARTVVEVSGDAFPVQIGPAPIYVHLPGLD
jgi:hypothetical protein